jgi:hypothetical protein
MSYFRCPGIGAFLIQKAEQIAPGGGFYREGTMNKSLRLAALTVLALVLTCMCLAGPIHTHHGRMPVTGCVLGCGNYCRAFACSLIEPAIPAITRPRP